MTKISPDLRREKKSEMSGTHQVQYFLAVGKTWWLTFAGFRAAKTVKQLTQEAMTSTGGEITVVNLVGEQCTMLSKKNYMTCSITNIFQFSSQVLVLRRDVKTGKPSPGDKVSSQKGFPQRNTWGLNPVGV